MGFFDKFKKKVTETVSKTVEDTSESVKKTTEFFKFDRLKSSLEKTKKTFSNSILTLLGNRKIDDKLLEEIEEVLLTSDIGVNTTEKLITILKERVKNEKN